MPTIPIIPRNRTAGLFALTDNEQNAYLYGVVKRAFKNLGKPAPPPTPASKEVLLRDMASTLFLLGGAQPRDIDFLFSAKPDGSRVDGLERIVSSLFRSASPANKLAHDTLLVESIVTDCRALGIVGERNLLLAIYLVGTSRLLDHPLSAIVQGSSSTGKSYLVSQVARLFPPEAVLNATRMTPQALYHTETLAHRFVVAGERSRKQDDDSADATGALRQLQSEGRISKLVTEQADGKFTSRLVEQEGPISYVETTTLRPGSIFPEDLNRALLLKTDESEEHTRQILAHSAGRYESSKAKTADVAAIVEKHRAFQAMLQRRAVSIPFARKLVGQVPVKKVAARRVGQQILSMIEAVTILHQFQRKQDNQGRLIATLQDYEVAVSILRQPLGESLGVKASPTKLYEKLATEFPVGEVFTTAQVQKLDGAGDRTVRGWLSELAECECIEQVEPAKGRLPAKWQLNGKRPEEVVLPVAAVLGI